MSSEEGQSKVILATAGYDHTIHFWQAHTGVRQHTVNHPSSQVNNLEIMPNRQLIAVAGYQHIRLYDILTYTPTPVVNYEGVPKNFTSVGFQEDGRWMFTGSEDNTARIWDMRSRSQNSQRQFPTNFPVNCVCLHPNQSELYIGDQGGSIYLWDLRSDRTDQQQVKKPFFKVPEADISIQSIHVDAEGTFMAAIDNKGSCYLFTLSSGTNENNHSQPLRRLKFEAHKTYGLKCLFSPDSTLLVTASADCTAKIWRTSELHLLLQPQSPPSTSGGQSSNREWKVTPVSPMIELKDNDQRWVWDLAFSADSQYIFTASSDNVARLWSVSTGEVKRVYSGHSKALTSIAFKDAV